MVRLINPEDWFLILTILASLVSFPMVLALAALLCRIPLAKVFNIKLWTIVFQLVGIFIFVLLLIQASIHADGMGVKLIYGRF